MSAYNVFYQVDGDIEENPDAFDIILLHFEAEDLDDLFEILRKGEEDGSIQSDLEANKSRHRLDLEHISIEPVYILSNHKEVFRKKGFMDGTEDTEQIVYKMPPQMSGFQPYWNRGFKGVEIKDKTLGLLHY